MNTVSTTGEAVTVTCGIARDRHGRRVVALGISTRTNPGPTAVVSQALAGRILANLGLTHAALAAEHGDAPPGGA